MRNSTLCYIERDGQYLMMHRIKKKNDQNQDKWIGIGGGFLEDESPEDCVRREALEETGLTLCNPKLYSVVTFVIEGGECEQMFLFKCTEFSGELTDCDEGELAWIDKDRLLALTLWEGDKIFLRLLDTRRDFFELTLRYRGEALAGAALDGEELDL